MSTSSPDFGVEFGLGFLGARELGYAELVFAQMFVWGIGDAVSTLLAFSLTGDLSLEANPIVRAVLLHDPLLLLVFKGAVAAVVGITLIECRDVVMRVPLWRSWMFVVLGLGSAVVASNFYVGFAMLV
ncbi:DUF5658 family protein [Halorientalis brevis]|uniref:DUF5658 family protein n=1 Tax=Halorientalis brevis TaxID=1126241 RepID=A0ABD6CDI3_9EURY|nr:DUF5658 family protein [Halorientalis brevis]